MPRNTAKPERHVVHVVKIDKKQTNNIPKSSIINQYGGVTERPPSQDALAPKLKFEKTS